MEQADAWAIYETARLLEISNRELGRIARADEHKAKADRIAESWPEFIGIFKIRHADDLSLDQRNDRR